jgi:hypothetical protein
MEKQQPPAVLTSGMSGLKLQEGDSNGLSLTSSIEAVLRDLSPPARLSTADRFSNECQSRIVRVSLLEGKLNLSSAAEYIDEELVDQYKFTSLQQLRLLTSELNGVMGANTLSDELVFRLWFTLLRLAGPGPLQSDEGRRLSQGVLKGCYFCATILIAMESRLPCPTPAIGAHFDSPAVGRSQTSFCRQPTSAIGWRHGPETRCGCRWGQSKTRTIRRSGLEIGFVLGNL